MCHQRDAQVLLAQQRFSAAYYLSGYAVELAMKACIAKKIRPETIPDKGFISSVFSHDLKGLAGLAVLADLMKAEAQANPAFRDNWVQACEWNEQSRYQVWSESQARTMVESISDATDGVLQWVRRHW